VAAAALDVEVFEETFEAGLRLPGIADDLLAQRRSNSGKPKACSRSASSLVAAGWVTLIAAAAWFSVALSPRALSSDQCFMRSRCTRRGLRGGAA